MELLTLLALCLLQTTCSVYYTLQECSHSSKEYGIFTRALEQRLLQRNPSTALAILTVSDTEHQQRPETVQSLKRIAQMIDWVSGPFVGRSFVLKSTCLLSWLEEHAVELPWTPRDVDLMLFDQFQEPLAFELLPVLADPLEVRSLLEERYRMDVQFALPRSADGPYELAWAHFRGNSQIVMLGEEPLVIHPGETVSQLTHAGHLYALLRPQQANSSTCQNPFDEHIKLSRIVTLLLMPATHTEGLTVVFSLTPQVLQGEGINLALIREQLLPGVMDWKAMLLLYWTKQRAVQMLPATWALPYLTPELWTMPSLSDELLARLRADYLHSREQPLVSAGAQEEAFISLVFNQHDIPTHYYPLPGPLLDELQAFVAREASRWTGIKVADLLPSGAYGVREYRTGAIVRWHVDPAHSQPITAIIHIADDCADGEGWSLQVPLPGHEEELDDPRSLQAIDLKAGDVLLLQSAVLPHARIQPLRAGYYGNVFVHLAPRGWAALPEVRAVD